MYKCITWSKVRGIILNFARDMVYQTDWLLAKLTEGLVSCATKFAAMNCNIRI